MKRLWQRRWLCQGFMFPPFPCHHHRWAVLVARSHGEPLASSSLLRLSHMQMIALDSIIKLASRQFKILSTMSPSLLSPLLRSPKRASVPFSSQRAPKPLSPFKKYLTYYDVHVWACERHDVGVEERGQSCSRSQFSPFISTRVLGVELRSSGLCGKNQKLCRTRQPPFLSIKSVCVFVGAVCVCVEVGVRGSVSPCGS